PVHELPPVVGEGEGDLPGEHAVVGEEEARSLHRSDGGEQRQRGPVDRHASIVPHLVARRPGSSCYADPPFLGTWAASASSSCSAWWLGWPPGFSGAPFWTPSTGAACPGTATG